jgi:NAD(P)-dependent dehydrogenase (short-subunit alcohol dehydrogenase family)
MAAVKAILVTGANKGIGLAITESILEDHDDTVVYMCCRDPSRGEASRLSLAHSHRAVVIPMDVASLSSVEAAARAVKESLEGRGIPHLHAIVNNAGIGSWDGSLPLEEVLAVNVMGIRNVSAHFVKHLHPHSGRVVNVTSASGPMFLAKASAELRLTLTNPRVEWKDIEEEMAKAFREDSFPVDQQYGFRYSVGDMNDEGSEMNVSRQMGIDGVLLIPHTLLFL